MLTLALTSAVFALTLVAWLTRGLGRVPLLAALGALLFAAWLGVEL